MTKEQTQTKLGAELRALRVGKGLRADFVASQMGISKFVLSRLEHGRRSWTEKLIWEFKLAIGMRDNKWHPISLLKPTTQRKSCQPSKK